MAITTHIFQVYISGDVQQVWASITDPEWTRRHLDATAVVEFTPPTESQPGRLVQTWHVLRDAALATEQPSEVEWTVERAGAGLTRVRVVHGDLAFSPLTWAYAKERWNWVLDALKTALETGRPLPEVSTASTTPGVVTSDWHRAQGVEANNATWELLGRSDRAPSEDEDLLRRAYAAAYHWQRTDSRKPENEARAAYMIAKALLATDQPARAMVSADHCLSVCQRHGLGDFDLAYAYEARTRALLALAREPEARQEWLAASAVEIADAEDKAIVVADFADLDAHFAGEGRRTGN